jgi:hypothetical protein
LGGIGKDETDRVRCIIAMGKPLAEDHLMALIAQHVVVLDAAPRHS